MDMVPQIGVIIEGIASEDKQKNQRSIELFRKYQGAYKWKIRNNVRRYDKKIWKKFIDLVLADTAAQLNVELRCIYLLLEKMIPCFMLFWII